MRRKIIPYKPYLKEYARKLRNDSTLGEVILWGYLNRKQMFGFDFHRQKPLLNYIVDFYCAELNLVIEIDGIYHNDNETYENDLNRDKELGIYNLTVLRFAEEEIRNDIINVIRVIESYIFEKFPDLEIKYKHTPNKEFACLQHLCIPPLERGVEGTE